MSKHDLGRLRWRCRRGMRELDELLTRFLDTDYSSADVEVQTDFERFLSLADPEILALLTRQRIADDLPLRELVERILGAPRAAGR